MWKILLSACAQFFRGSDSSKILQIAWYLVKLLSEYNVVIASVCVVQLPCEKHKQLYRHENVMNQSKVLRIWRVVRSGPIVL